MCTISVWSELFQRESSKLDLGGYSGQFRRNCLPVCLPALMLSPWAAGAWDVWPFSSKSCSRSVHGNLDSRTWAYQQWILTFLGETPLLREWVVLCLVTQSCLTLCDPRDCSPPGSSVHGDSPGKNTGVGCRALLQGIPNPGVEPRFPTLWVDSLLCEPAGKPKNTGAGILSLLQGIFPTQESNQCLLHCRRILYQLSYQGSYFAPKVSTFLLRTFEVAVYATWMMQRTRWHLRSMLFHLNYPSGILLFRDNFHALSLLRNTLLLQIKFLNLKVDLEFLSLCKLNCRHKSSMIHK